MSSQTQAPSARLTLLDQSRALAIIAMIIFHFGEGALSRLPQLAHIGDYILLLGRLATPAFITVFGITAGFVYFKAIEKAGTAPVFSNIHRRTRFIVLGALAISIPAWINLLIAQDSQFNHWLFSFYSVLNFYALAFLSLPTWILLTRANPQQRCLALGVVFWLIGMGLYQIWARNPDLGFFEYIRLHLCSGAYSYFHLAGYALLLMPLGIQLRIALQQNQLSRYFLQLAGLGIILTCIGLLLGYLSQELSLQAIVKGTVKAPPRIWYFMLFGGVSLIMIALVGTLEQLLQRAQLAYFVYPLTLFGQVALPIYVGHAFVLPSLNWLDYFIKIEGILRIVLPLSIFVLFCLIMMYRKHLQITQK